MAKFGRKIKLNIAYICGRLDDVVTDRLVIIHNEMCDTYFTSIRFSIIELKVEQPTGVKYGK